MLTTSSALLNKRKPSKLKLHEIALNLPKYPRYGVCPLVRNFFVNDVNCMYSFSIMFAVVKIFYLQG